MSRDRYDRLGPVMYGREQLRRQEAANEKAEREIAAEQQAVRAEHQVRARERDKAATERVQSYQAAAVDLTRARAAVEDAVASFDDAVAAARIKGAEIDEAAAWAAIDDARRELRACEVVAARLRS
jgi:hypothetical protein